MYIPNYRARLTFNELPVEIILMIFYIHVYAHREAKQTLLLDTCQTRLGTKSRLKIPRYGERSLGKEEPWVWMSVIPT